MLLGRTATLRSWDVLGGLAASPGSGSPVTTETNLLTWVFGETTTWHIWLQNTSVDYCWLLQYPVQCALSGHLLVSRCRSHSWRSHWLLPKHRVKGLRAGFGLVHHSPARERTQGRQARSWAGRIPQPSNAWQMVAQGRGDIQRVGEVPRG